MDEQDIIPQISTNLNLPTSINYSMWIQLVENKINEMLVHDFDRLISLLRRIDISEQKLRYLLHTNEQDNAGKIIAALIIERERQKQQARKTYHRPISDDPDMEKW